MAASTYFAQVQQLYIAYFGRPADTIGQAYWANQIDAANGSIASVIAGFSASAESAALFGNKSSIDKVTAIYQNAFGRAPEPAGLAYWVAQLDSGKVSQAQASWTIQQSAGAGDAAAVQNKLTAAQAFTAQIDTTAEITGYQGAAAAESARAFLKTVTADNATATAAVTGAAAAVVAATAVGVVGATYTLTTGVDALNGDGGNNTFIGDNTGANATVTAGDSINGGAGTDTFNYFTAGGATVAPQLNSVENVNLIGGVTTVDLSGAVGLQQATLKNTAVVTTGTGVTIGAGVAAGLDKVTSATATFTGPATQTAATLNVVNGSNVTTVAVNGAAITTLNVVSAAGAANTIGSLTSTGTETTLNVGGAGDLTINTVGDTLTTINASAATGKTVINAAGTGNITYTGGTGNDTIKFGATQLTAADVLDGGAGIDTLSILDTTAPYAVINAAKNFEVLGLGAAVTVDASQLTSLKAFSLEADAAYTISNMATGGTVAVTTAHGAASNIALSSNTGIQDLGLTIGVAGKAGVAVAGSLTVGQTNIALSSLGDGVTGHTIKTLVNADNSVITVTGNNNLTITDALAGTAIGSKVDASALTGKLSVIGSAKNDILIGGSNDDTLGGGAGVNTLTGGAGKDLFVITGSVYGASKDVTTITDFVKGTDKLVSGAAVPTALTKVAVTELTLDLALGEIAAKAATDTTAAWGVFGGNTYVVAGGDALAALGATDVVVKLAGTVDLGTTAGDIFAVVV